MHGKPSKLGFRGEKLPEPEAFGLGYFRHAESIDEVMLSLFAVKPS
jgi:hypothetical protein